MTATPPVLFLIFNRPDLTAQVFQRIRELRPAQLFVAADGPRSDREGEAQLCAAARQTVERGVDWDCDVKELFREKNLGCKIAVSSAIAWFFEHVEEGIILEDDCLPSPGFFPFCSELLTRYRDDERIMAVCGSNFQDGLRRGSGSYYFSIYNQIWAWATWRRAWRFYDPELLLWPSLKPSKWLAGVTGSGLAAAHLGSDFDRITAGTYDTWDAQWNFCCWTNHGLALIPNENLVTNLGFDERATHTKDALSKDAKRTVAELAFPLVHPRLVHPDYEADAYTARHQYGIGCEKPRTGRVLRRIAGRVKWILNQSR